MCNGGRTSCTIDSSDEESEEMGCNRGADHKLIRDRNDSKNWESWAAGPPHTKADAGVRTAF
jgi:hypothetical protein